MLAEIGVPDVDDEDRAVAIAAVPCLMLNRVVKCERLPLDPLSSLAADAERASFGNDQRQMDNAADVGHAGVRRDVAARLQNRKEDVRRATLDVAQRKRF